MGGHAGEWGRPVREATRRHAGGRGVGVRGAAGGCAVGGPAGGSQDALNSEDLFNSSACGYVGIYNENSTQKSDWCSETQKLNSNIILCQECL